MTVTFAEAAASVVLRLAKTPSQQVLDHAQQGRASLHVALQPLYTAARAAWVTAAAETASHVALVVANNPEKTLTEVLGRPDVQQALRENWQQAGDRARQALLAAWDAGAERGVAQAEADMVTLGMQSQGAPAPFEVGEAMRQTLLDDLDRNIEATGERMVAAVQTSGGQPEDVRAAVAGLASVQASRTRAGITVAGAEAYHAAQTRMYADAAAAGGYVVKVMWVTHFRPTTCATCAALHGEVVVLGQEFDHFAHMGSGTPPKVFGSLQGPPRHPNCGCRLVPFIDAEVEEQAKVSPTVDTPPTRTDSAGPTPQTLKRYREAWFKVLLRKIKTLFGRNDG